MGKIKTDELEERVGSAVVGAVDIGLVIALG